MTSGVSYGSYAVRAAVAPSMPQGGLSRPGSASVGVRLGEAPLRLSVPTATPSAYARPGDSLGLGQAKTVHSAYPTRSIGVAHSFSPAAAASQGSLLTNAPGVAGPTAASGTVPRLATGRTISRQEMLMKGMLSQQQAASVGSTGFVQQPSAPLPVQASQSIGFPPLERPNPQPPGGLPLGGPGGAGGEQQYEQQPHFVSTAVGPGGAPIVTVPPPGTDVKQLLRRAPAVAPTAAEGARWDTPAGGGGVEQQTRAQGAVGAQQHNELQARVVELSTQLAAQESRGASEAEEMARLRVKLQIAENMNRSSSPGRTSPPGGRGGVEQQMEAQLAVGAQQYNELQARVAGLSTQLAAQESRGASETEEIARLREKLQIAENMNRSSSPGGQQYNEIQARVAGLSTQLAAQESRGASETEEIARLREKLQIAENMNRSSSPGAQQYNEIQVRVAELSTQLAAQESRGASEAEEMARLREKLQVAENMNRLSSPGKISSPTAADRRNAAEVERLTDRLVDLEAQLLDAGQSRDSMQEALKKEHAKTAELQRHLSVLEAQVYDQSAQRLPDDVRSKTDRIVSWLPALGRQQPELRRETSADTATRLFEAVADDNIELVKAALALEDDVVEAVLNARDDRGQSLLHVSLAKGSGEAAQFILSQGQRWASGQKYIYDLRGELLMREISNFVNGQDKNGRSPLATLCQREDPGREEVVLALINSDADPMQRDDGGNTPFIECARSGNTKLMKLLLEYTRGAVLLDVDNANRSALHWSAFEGKLAAVELLLKVRADAETHDDDGFTAVEAARSQGHEEVVTLLEKRVSDSDIEEQGEQEDGSEPKIVELGEEQEGRPCEGGADAADRAQAFGQGTSVMSEHLGVPKGDFPTEMEEDINAGIPPEMLRMHPEMRGMPREMMAHPNMMAEMMGMPPEMMGLEPEMMGVPPEMEGTSLDMMAERMGVPVEMLRMQQERGDLPPGMMGMPHSVHGEPSEMMFMGPDMNDMSDIPQEAYGMRRGMMTQMPGDLQGMPTDMTGARHEMWGVPQEVHHGMPEDPRSMPPEMMEYPRDAPPEMMASAQGLHGMPEGAPPSSGLLGGHAAPMRDRTAQLRAGTTPFQL